MATPAAIHSEEEPSLEAWVSRFAATSSEAPARTAVASMVGSFWVGRGVLPTDLGLDAKQRAAVIGYAFGPDPELWAAARGALLQGADCPGAELIRDRAALRAVLAAERKSEVQDVCALLLGRGRAWAPASVLDFALAQLLAYGCLGAAHLWRDLGLQNRAQLRVLIGRFFPAMIELNVGDMRWKRFLYRQLCELGGDYVCRAPSCSQCSSYTECFVGTAVPRA
jgi:nitrogen fixation protein NifQ